MKYAILTAVLFLQAGVAAGQRARIPAFSAFPAAVEKARVKRIDFRSNPGARAFRTRLAEGLRGGVNFAGHYVLTGWGCGTGCVHAVVIDARTGRVHFPWQLNGIAVSYNDSGYEEPLNYRKNSRLLLISGIPGNSAERGPELPSGKYYYEWKNNRFRLIRFIEVKNG